MKKITSFILTVSLLAIYSISIWNAYASTTKSETYLEIIHGTFHELILKDRESEFASVSIRDDYHGESLFTEVVTITRRIEVRRMLNVLGRTELTGINHDDYIDISGYYSGIRLTFSEIGAPGTQVVSLWGINHDQLIIVIFPEQGLMSVHSSHDIHVSYFYFNELDVLHLLDVNPLSLLNPGLLLAFFSFCIIIFMLLRFWFGGDNIAPLRKSAYAQKYIISIWLMLFVIASLMVNSNHPLFFQWILRISFFVFSLTVLIHSKKHGLRRIMTWELIGTFIALILAFILSSPASEAVVRTLRWIVSNIFALLLIGAPIYMLFLVLAQRHKPSQRRIRTKITLAVTIIVTVLFFLLIFHPHVFREVEAVGALAKSLCAR